MRTMSEIGAPNYLSGGLPASWRVRDTRSSIRALGCQGRQRFLGAERTKEGFLEKLAFNR